MIGDVMAHAMEPNRARIMFCWLFRDAICKASWRTRVRIRTAVARTLAGDNAVRSMPSASAIRSGRSRRIAAAHSAPAAQVATHAVPASRIVMRLHCNDAGVLPLRLPRKEVRGSSLPEPPACRAGRQLPIRGGRRPGRPANVYCMDLTPLSPSRNDLNPANASFFASGPRRTASSVRGDILRSGVISLIPLTPIPGGLFPRRLSGRGPGLSPGLARSSGRAQVAPWSDAVCAANAIRWDNSLPRLAGRPKHWHRTFVPTRARSHRSTGSRAGACPQRAIPRSR